MKTFVKLLSGFVAAIIIAVVLFYFFRLQPVLAQFNFSDLRMEYASSDTSGFPFRTIIKIETPVIYKKDKAVWKGDGAVMEWSINRPTSITIRLKGKHILTIRDEKPSQMLASLQLYLADTVGFIKLSDFNNIVTDIRANRIGLYSGNLLNPQVHTKIMGSETVYFSYDGPSYAKKDKTGGDLTFSAENADISNFPGVPFKKNIERFTIKSLYDKKSKKYIIPNFILFWDKLKIAGNGTYTPQTGSGDFVIAATGFEYLVRSLYDKKYLPADSVQALINNFNKLQEQQKKSENQPVYMPMSYRNNTIKLTGIDILTIPTLFAE